MSDLTLGDLLDSAGRHLEAAGGTGDPAVPDGASGTRQLHRLVTAMTRYLDCTTVRGEMEAATPPATSSWEREANGLRDALRLAGDRILTAAAHFGEPNNSRAGPHVRQLAAAADAVAAGADLLRTHTAAGPDGQYIERSGCARLLTCQPVVMAVTAQIAQWSGRAASWTAWLAQATTANPAARAELAAASAWLWAGEDSVRLAAAGPQAVARRELLRGFRVASPPERIPPHDGEHATGLHAGIAISAERLRAIVFIAPQEAMWSPGTASPAWLRTARAIAVISDLAELTLKALAERSAQLIAPPVRAGLLDAAASAFRDARITWEQVTTLWRAMSTDAQTRVSAATMETGDLVLRMGRLVFDNSQWTPAFSQRASLRSAESLAPDHAGFTATLSAVHQGADAVVCLGSADLDAMIAAHNAGRFYMSNHILQDDWYPQSRVYVRAPRDRVWFLRQAYQGAISASLRAARALDGPALEAGAPSKILALRRAAVTAVNDRPPRAEGMDFNAVERRMSYFMRPWGAPGLPREEIDADAVIRAYQQDQQTLRECADQHMASIGTITAILEEHGIRRRPPGARELCDATWNAGSDYRETTPTAPAHAPAAQGGWTPHAGPVETAVAATSNDDPGLLLRAAALDKAATTLLNQATQDRSVGNDAARLASSNFPYAPTTRPPGSANPTAGAHPAEPKARRRPDRPHGRGRNPGQRPA
jgi:hypothetical protein